MYLQLYLLLDCFLLSLSLQYSPFGHSLEFTLAYVNFLLVIWKCEKNSISICTTSTSFSVNESLIKFGANCNFPNKVYSWNFLELKIKLLGQRFCNNCLKIKWMFHTSAFTCVIWLILYWLTLPVYSPVPNNSPPAF